MADLRSTVQELGFTEVSTLLQSGNLLFTSTSDADDLESALEEAILAKFGFAAKTFIRSAADWDQIIADNPFPEFAATRPNHLLVTACREVIPQAMLDEIQQRVKGSERMIARGSVLYTTYPDGIGDSKLPSTPGFSKLPVGTARNWNTVLRIQSGLANPVS